MNCHGKKGVQKNIKFAKKMNAKNMNLIYFFRDFNNIKY